MSNLEPIPEHLKDAIRKGKRIDPNDPYVRKMMREDKKEKKKKKFDYIDLLNPQVYNSATLEEKKRFEKQKNKYILKGYAAEVWVFNRLIYEQNNTMDWKVKYECKYPHCNSLYCRDIKMLEKNTHYAERRCVLCDRHVKWLSYP